MPLVKLQLAPGINAMETRTQNNGWFAGNLIRWRNGLLEKVGGWQRLFATQTAGIVRAMHSYLDLLNEKNLLLGTDGGLQVYVVTQGQANSDGTIYNLGFVGYSASQQVTLTPTNTSTLVSAALTAHNALVGDSLTFNATFSVGGRVVVGPYTTTVVGVPDANHFTFNMPLAATNSTANATPFPSFTFSDPVTGLITLIAHGLAISNSFVVQLYTEGTGYDGSVKIPAGTTLTVTAVPTADTFRFNISAFGTWSGTAGSPFNKTKTVTEGESPAGQQALISFTVSSSPSPRQWFLDNLGTNALIVYPGSPLFVFTPPASSSAHIANAGSETPQVNAGMLVLMPQAQVLLWGSEVIIGQGQQDPLFVRWSDAGGYTNFTADADNQAGSYRLGGNGTRIVGGIQAPQTTLIFTDVDLWSMTYVGPPLVYGFATIATGCGLVAPFAMAILGRTCLWMSYKGFFAFSDSGVTPVRCPVWDVIFNDLDTDNLHKIFLGTNSSPHEIWAFYPSLSGGTGECDKYVKVNIVENLWDYGTLSRSSWLEDNDFGPPLGADTNYRIQQHEMGYDDDLSAMAGVYAETGFFDLASGDQIPFLDEYEQDMKWFGDNGAASVTFHGTNYSGASEFSKGPYGLDSENRLIRPRMRARYLAARFDWAERRGFSARFGVPRVRIASSGRRP